MHVRTKIICTIGPSVASREMIEKLIINGMNVARLNFSHGTHQEHLQVIKWIKKAREKLGIPVAIMLDTKGPEIRIGQLVDHQLVVSEGDTITLVKQPVPKEKKKIPLNPPEILKDITKGMTILFDDGYVEGKVLQSKEGEVEVSVLNNGCLRDNIGINIPHSGINIPGLTEQDKEDIQFGCKHGIDIIAASFIRSSDHVIEIKELLAREKHPEILVFSKIESAVGVKNFDSILNVSDGIMVARGDLGVEVPLAQVPRLQKMMIKNTYRRFKSVITATQMLESMIHNPRPTRAEISDIANAIYDCTSAVMLSGETAIGKYPIETLTIMKETIYEAEKDFDAEKFFAQEVNDLSFNDISSSVALAVVKTAYSARGKAIFAFTSSGFTAKAMARFRPMMPIIALTPKEKIYHQLSIYWGVVPVLEEVANATEGFAAASCYALKHKLAHYGDLIVLSAGSPFGISGTTNMMLVDNIGDVLVRGLSGKGRKVIGKVTIIQSSESNRHYLTKGNLIVIPFCDETIEHLVKDASALILQNQPEDVEAEECAKGFGKKYKIPVLVRADSACALLRDGQVVTLDPPKGLVFKGVVKSDENMLPDICPM